MNTVQQILQYNFSTISLKKKMEMKIKGRPTPDLNIVQNKKSKIRDYIRKLNSNDSNDIYKMYN